MANIANKEEIAKVVKEIIKEDLDRIVEEHLLNKEKKFKDISVLERIIVIEQSLQNTNKRLEDLIYNMDKRFEQVDKRFGQVDKRFEDLNKRINFISWFIPTIITVVVAVLKYISLNILFMVLPLKNSVRRVV